MKIFNFEIKKINKHKNSIVEINNYELKLIKKCLAYSMTNMHRMWSLVQSFHHIKQKKISGDFVECGVWKGGNLILLKTLLEKYNLKKKIYGFDTFEGMHKNLYKEDESDDFVNYDDNFEFKVLGQFVTIADVLTYFKNLNII